MASIASKCASLTGFPVSLEIKEESSSICFVKTAFHARRRFLRSSELSDRHQLPATTALSTVRLTAETPEIGKCPTSAPVAGFREAKVSVDMASFWCSPERATTVES